MKSGFYPKLAWSGIRKNRRLYFPYILTGALMVMMFYILSYLRRSPALEDMPGGSVLMVVLPLGCAVIGVFSLLFLFYTNSFLMKQRYREFGLYNILGMDKRNIGRVMLWETLFTAALAIAAGLAAGMLLSKAAEMVLLNLLHREVSFRLNVGLSALWQTALIFAGVYLLLLVNAVLRVGRARPLELMQSSRVGEKPPRFGYGLGILGVLLLGAAYYLAVRIQEPVTAMFVFFAAVVMVILGTYLLFISGSVAFCRLLQRNRRYYYKPNHFVSVSSMIYHMKRNGAGLASICILLTMVLVMISSTASLYFGEEDSLRNRYPNGINLKLRYDDAAGIGDANLNMMREAIAEKCPEDVDLRGMRACSGVGMFTDDGMLLNYESAENISLIDYDRVGYLYVFPLEDYNRAVGASERLEADECLLFSDRLSLNWNSFSLEYGGSYRVRERLSSFPEDRDALAMTMPSVYLVVEDIEAFSRPLRNLCNGRGDLLMSYEWSCGFDLSAEEEEIAAESEIRSAISRLCAAEGSLIRSYEVQSRALQRESFFEMYGSLFFLGIMLSIVFLLAAVLIIYYKQISEGYEDQSRFEIMQKVGMTKRDIRRSINSQMLTVFFLPLVTAGVHLAFAYPFISKILLMFAFDNALLNIMVNLICFAAFGLLYAVVYKITSGAYYAIVSEGRD